MTQIAFFQSIILFSLGASVLSFILTLSRYPRTLLTRSFCHGCLTPLPWYHLVPVFSYINLKGACAYCPRKIFWCVPFAEFLGGIWFVLAPFTDHSYVWCALGMSLWPLALCDIERGQLPHVLLLFFMILTLTLYGADFNAWITGISLFGFFVFLNECFKLLNKKHAIGMGDMKLLGIMGFWFPFDHWAFFFGIVGGLGVFFGFLWTRYKKQEAFPFAPCIVIAFFICWYTGYIRLF